MRSAMSRRWIERLNAALDRAALIRETLGHAVRSTWDVLSPLRSGLRAHSAQISRHPLAWSLLYVVLACALCFAAIDRPLALWMKAHVGGDIEGFFKTVTQVGEAQYYLIPSGVLCLGLLLTAARVNARDLRSKLREWAIAPGFLFLSIAISGLISNLLKFSIGRYRPRYLFDQGLYGFNHFSTHWGMNSFPSGHSQAAFAAMTALMIIFPRYDVFWLAVAVLVAASRIATTVHYLSDTIAGAWLAIAVTVVVARQFRRHGWNPRIRLPHDHRLSE